MRTQDRTYREAMMHADPDRKTPLHDQACLYLAHETRLDKLGQMYKRKVDDFYFFTQGRAEHRFCLVDRKLEVPVSTASISVDLQKENGWIIGYADVFVDIKYKCTATVSYDPPLKDKKYTNCYGFYKLDVPIETDKDTQEKRIRVLIEVKTQPISPAAIIQQFHTYNSVRQPRLGSPLWDENLLCTLYPISSIDRDAFLREGIRTIYVDPQSVEAFIDAQTIHEQEKF